MSDEEAKAKRLFDTTASAPSAAQLARLMATAEALPAKRGPAWWWVAGPGLVAAAAAALIALAVQHEPSPVTTTSYTDALAVLDGP